MAVWLITGAGRGIGLEMTRQLLADGETVVATARRPEALADLASSRLKVIALDVTDKAAVAALGESVGETLDVIVNNAGVLIDRNETTLAPDLSWEIFEETLRVNTIAPLFVTRALLPRLRQPGGKVLMVTSGMGSLAQDSSDTTAYRASKAGLNRITRGLARDLAPRGVAVLSMHPGWVRTAMGGPGAAVAVEDSAAGLIARVRALDLSTTGRFVGHDGKAFPW